MLKGWWMLPKKVLPRRMSNQTMRTKSHTVRRMMRRINLLRNMRLIHTLNIFLKMLNTTKHLNNKRPKPPKIALMLTKKMMNLTLKCQTRTVSHSSTQIPLSTTSEGLRHSISLKPHKRATSRHHKTSTCPDQPLGWSSQYLRNTWIIFLVKMSSSNSKDKWSKSNSKWDRWC